MKMKAWAFAAMVILAAGCSNGSAVGERSDGDATNAGVHQHRTGGTSTLTQASSITSEDAKGRTIAMQQQAAPQGGGWFDWVQLDRWLGRNAPARNPGTPQPPQGQTAQRPPAQNADPQTGTDASRYSQEVLNIVNQERAKSGLKPLSMNGALSNMAMDKAKDMVNNRYFDHQSPTYGSPFDMMDAYGISYSTAAENIAQGQRSPAEVMNAWMNSQGHRANILNGSFTQIGVAYYNGSWVQVFTG